MAAAAAEDELPLQIGLIADIQYSDREDGADFGGHEVRHFRNALQITRNAVDYWNAKGVTVVVQLGDIIDGCNKGANASTSALKQVLQVLEKCNAKTRYDLIGNHELYNVPRGSLVNTPLACIGIDGRTFRSERLNELWQAIILDPYEHSLIGVQAGDPGHEEGVKVINTYNPKCLQGPGDWFTGLPRDLHRYVPFNGSCSPQQIAWLKQALMSVAAEKRKALIFCHIPIYTQATTVKTVVWNAEEILKVLHAFADSVVAVIAGHDHNGGYAVDEAGVHHITMCSPMTADVGTDCFALLECHTNGRARFIARGRACVESGTKNLGRSYPVLFLAKDATNEATGPALPPGSRQAPQPAGAGTTAAAAPAAAGAGPAPGDQEDPDDPPGLDLLVEMGFDRAAARARLLATGSVEAAAAMLLEA